MFLLFPEKKEVNPIISQWERKTFNNVNPQISNYYLSKLTNKKKIPILIFV